MSSSRGPYAAAGPYAGGTEVRLERVPGGLRLAEWQAGQIARKAPELDASDLPGAAGRGRGQGARGGHAPERATVPASEGGYGASPGRTGDMREELRVERVGADRVRIARWVLRPNAGWQLQDAPVMLPAARFREAIESAAEQGVLPRRWVGAQPAEPAAPQRPGGSMSSSWTAADIPDQSGRTAIVTGANSGLGLNTARELARAGARVVLACRNMDKGEAARAGIAAQVPGAQLELEALDLSSLDSVRSFAGERSAKVTTGSTC